jgi:cellulose biosynthesis protein BcsQ
MMAARVLASYNLKGGVGKTAAAVNLSYSAVRRGWQVLLWDLDPQAAATFYFRVEPGVKGGAKKLVSGKRELADFIKATNYPGLDLMPADFSYRNLDLYFARRKKSEDRLGRLLAPVQDEYDLIVLDCAPGISLVSENVFRAADALLMPLIPTFLSTRAYERLQRYFAKRPEITAQLLPFFSMVDRRRSLHRELVESFARAHPEALRAFIGYASMVELMGRFRAPLQTYAASSEPARAFDALWLEVEVRLGLEPAAAARAGVGIPGPGIG